MRKLYISNPKYLLLMFLKSTGFKFFPIIMGEKYVFFVQVILSLTLQATLIHISILILRHFLYLVYVSPCLDVGLFMSYLCDLCLFLTFIYH